MIQRLSHTTLYVLNQDSAKDFYVNKLGFEVRMDAKMDNGFRWLTVSPKGQPDLQVILMQVDGPNMQPDVANDRRHLHSECVSFVDPTELGVERRGNCQRAEPVEWLVPRLRAFERV